MKVFKWCFFITAVIAALFLLVSLVPIQVL